MIAFIPYSGSERVTRHHSLPIASTTGGTLNSRRAASPLGRLVEGEEMWEASDHLQSAVPLNWYGIEPNRTVSSMVLKATANGRHHLAFCHDEFRHRWH
ncbi:uncharacterized protein TNCV_3282071 [Trichonephila clavipes]|nr:uncharacterized protein TNCV_3282071 [Trichonephila clavipes]